MPDSAPDENGRLDALVGTWRTQGEIYGEDGSTPVGKVDGTDAYEWLGRHFVIHRIDVDMAGEAVQGLEIIGPYDPDAGNFPTRAYDNHGGVETSVASIDADGAWRFGAEGATATLRIAADGQNAEGDWVRSDDGGTSWRAWLRLRLTRED